MAASDEAADTIAKPAGKITNLILIIEKKMRALIKTLLAIYFWI